MASTIALSPFPCSNTSGDINNGTPCPKEASIDCKKCHLVGYCSNPCSKAHWRTHKKDCENVTRGEKWQPRWVSERRTPIFFLPNALNHLDLPVGESERNIWGAIPAFDILQINENEGKFFQGDLRLCFAGDQVATLFITIANSRFSIGRHEENCHNHIKASTKLYRSL